METRLKRTIDLAPAVQRLGKTTDYRANDFQGELVEMARFLGSRQSFWVLISQVARRLACRFIKDKSVTEYLFTENRYLRKAARGTVVK